jgi:2-methylisocitrate lyase-like PEP mutase family enzyme
MDTRVAAFRKLHDAGCFVIPNPWDAGSAVALHAIGFPALATTSAGMAFARARPDSVGAISREDVLAHMREIVAATPLPVNADYQNGYADEPEDVAASVTECVATGVAGLSIEDATGQRDAPLYERSLAIERIRAARRAIDATRTGVVLTARCEAWLVGDANPATTAIDRLVAFADAGADCLFAPGVRDAETIATIVRAVAPRPVNVLMSAPNPELDVARLRDLGVRRVSLGSALSRVAWGAFLRAAREIHEAGRFDALAGAASFGELSSMFSERRGRA